MRQDELSAVAHHEAGHACAALIAFKTAPWLPHPAPPLPVRYIEITEDAPGQWRGVCVATNIYSTRWPEDRVAPCYCDLMQRQIAIHFGGGIAEAVHRGERRGRAVLSFATRHCNADADLRRARTVLADLYRLTGCHNGEQYLAERTLAMLLANWRSVAALAAALIEHRRIEGEQVERIINDCMIGSAS
jgi:hypothetical protein